MDDLYVAARRVLLDGLEALGTHRGAMILVGAQAIYLRVGDTDLAVAPYTTDADLVIDPSRLAEMPPLEQSLREASFRPQSDQSVGIWVTTRSVAMKDVDIAIDLLVPATVSRNASSRAADLTGHDRKAARNVEGLDAALIDNDTLTIGALEPVDERTFELPIAGPAALLTSKLHKIADRAGSGRLSDKDALDVLRLLRGTTTDELSRRYRTILSEPKSRSVAERGLELLQNQFIGRNSIGATMMTRTVGALADPKELEASARALSEDLVAALSR